MSSTGLSTDELAALSSQLNPSRQIKMPNGVEISIRGIALDDALTIYRRHAGELSAWFERLALQAMENPEAGFSFDANIASALVDTLPTVTADIVAIAMGYDDPAVIGIVQRMALAPKIAALEAIADLTFTEDMPPKKLFETVIQAAGLVRTSTPQSDEA
ncbi:hypothetical protein [Sphingopyxis sp. GW247-27LB]|uniref:phage pre-tape measure protein n=1 Tax=Sphingopyxis sp. GW247-27LB TaxID=2012632 RepID=UPI000BA5060A|nr:hypothetical protein [Sphingopyxis sp. GW247-27LB]PAL23538.1 hypothetical protein CD928_05580 [Sphingopyxis sp. GW247-27LB]